MYCSDFWIANVLFEHSEKPALLTIRGSICFSTSLAFGRRRGAICLKFCSGQNAHLGYIKEARVLCSLPLVTGKLQNLPANSITTSLNYNNSAKRKKKQKKEKTKWRAWLTLASDIRGWHSDCSNENIKSWNIFRAAGARSMSLVIFSLELFPFFFFSGLCNF